MLQSHHALAILAVAVATLGSVACKTRDPNSAGLLDSRPNLPTSAGEESNDTWSVVCKPAIGNGVEEASDVRYLFTVAGGVSQYDDSQPIIVSVSKEEMANGSVIPLSSSESGRGAVSPNGSIFVGFPSGVLTATFGTASLGTASHGGIMTLSTDVNATAIAVDCEVTQARAGASHASF